MELIKEILKFIDIVTATYLIYYVITGLCSAKSKKTIKSAKQIHKIGIIIPARNEEKVIGSLLKSLSKQDYPKDKYDTYVVLNNCTDRTKEIALENGAKIIECQANIKSKGEALRIAFNELNRLDYEAYIIFDADNIVHPKFITKMNNAVDEGYDVAQGFRDSKNVGDTWVSGCYSIHYLIHNTFLNQARMNIEKSCFINGTGLMITKSFLKRKGYKAYTLTEDIELNTKCAIDDERIAYVEDAITYDEQPTTFEASWHQRKRWSIGTVQCFKLYSGKLIKRILKKSTFSRVDNLIYLLAPIVQFLGAITYVMHLIIGLIQFSGINYMSKIFMILMWYLASLIFSVIVIKSRKKRILPYIKGIIMLPVFIISWIPINVIACFSANKENTWKKIEHTRNVTIDKMLEANFK